ncbi:remodeling and spacing factor 1-like [Venturia canescens]|uniref:remodeling and spacing factor 1-like n=1 Tax=Venturia canescens TaxID=32260 RepID=UPI001C9C4812|nr:remodeling and spacing factor 1-like [Venturia canescens]
MVKPSNPKLMARVLEAVTYLGDGKGSVTRDILKFVKQKSASSSRNLTMQVQRALKHAVTAGLLGCRSGRYKMQLELSNVPHRRQHEDSDEHKNSETRGDDMSDELQIDGTNLSRKIQSRQKPSRKKRPAQKPRKRNRVGVVRKATKRRAATIEKRGRKMDNRTRRRTINGNDREEDWAARKRRMMSKAKFYIDDDDEEEDEEEDIRESRRLPKIKSVNEDRYSNASGDSSAVGRHRSRRSKHLAKERRSPPRKGNGDTESQRKSSRRSTSRRRRSQPRQRETRELPAAEEPVEDCGRITNEEQETGVVEMDEDQGDIERSGIQPDIQGNE